MIAIDGTVAELVDHDLVAWHALDYNNSHLGVELVQSKPGDIITDSQYKSLAWWLLIASKRYGFPLDAQHLPQHKNIPPGIAQGKSDIGLPFDIDRLLMILLVHPYSII